MTVSTQTKVKFFFYRLSSFTKSFKALYTLPPEKVDAFINSYEIFNHDWKDEEELIAKMGENYYQEAQQKIIDYYSVLNLLCSLGPVEKMYIPPIMDPTKGVVENQNLFEQKMVKDLKIKKGQNVLDVGCGRGRIAHNVARITGANVIGFNIDKSQIEHAKKFAEGTCLDHLCTFQQHDMNDLPLPFKSESFDAIYQIQAFSYSKDIPKLLDELYRILKPGGRISGLDWMTLENYDSKNKEHVELINQIKPLLGAIGTPNKAGFKQDFLKAGFKIIVAETPSVDEIEGPLIEKASKHFTLVNKIITGLVKVKILPKHFKTLLDRLNHNADKFIEVDKMKLATTNYHLVAEK